MNTIQTLSLVLLAGSLIACSSEPTDATPATPETAAWLEEWRQKHEEAKQVEQARERQFLAECIETARARTESINERGTFKFEFSAARAERDCRLDWNRIREDERAEERQQQRKKALGEPGTAGS